MKRIRNMSQAELGAYVQSHLRKKGIEVILSGGASVSIFSRGKYVSKDLDLVNIYSKDRKAIREAMKEIGFTEEARYFRHEESPFPIEFPPGPLTIGAEPVKEIRELKYSTGTLRVISPADCVKDRLAAYYHWGDNQCLLQAAMVFQENNVDIREISRWSAAEGKREEFNRIRNVLTGEEKLL
jgi:hypothetical protein